jgi:hypothetical protein
MLIRVSNGARPCMEVVMKILLDEKVKSIVTESDVLNMLKAVGVKYYVDELFIDIARLRLLTSRAVEIERKRNRSVALWNQVSELLK